MTVERTWSQRDRYAVSLGRGLGVLFIAMGVTVAALSLAVLEPFHRTMRHTDESLQTAEVIAKRVQSGVGSSAGIISGVTSSLEATSDALNETVNLLTQTGSTLQRIRNILPILADDLGRMSGAVGMMMPGNRFRETSEKIHALRDNTEDLELEVLVLSHRVTDVRSSLDSLAVDVTTLEHDMEGLEASLVSVNRTLSRFSGSFSPTGMVAVFIWVSLLMAVLFILTGAFLLLKLEPPRRLSD